jgi:hypothetical protein
MSVISIPVSCSKTRASPTGPKEPARGIAPGKASHGAMSPAAGGVHILTFCEDGRTIAQASDPGFHFWRSAE